MLNILLLAGGNSPERDVSLRSGAAVTTALQNSGHAVTVLDPAQPIADETYRQYDVIFPVLHGVGGEDGVLQAHLESLGLHNYVGCDAASSKLCFDKWRYKSLLRQHGITTPQGDLVTGNLQAHPLAQKPFVLKPFDGGSSVDTFIVRDVASADFAVLNEAITRHSQMLIEELVSGTEITVGVLGTTALPVIEIIPPANGEFDYENKYNGQTQELCPPLHVPAEVQATAKTLAATIHALCGCRDMSRTDMILDAAGALYVLETNTIPGMTNQSLLPKAAAAAGISMEQLCEQLAQAAASRRSA